MTGAEFGGVDIDLLADYIGGVLTGTPDESVVAALIADDPAWQAAYESLSGGMELVGAELGRLDPEPMPADLAARLEAMFTNATTTSSTTASSTTAASTDLSLDRPAIADTEPIPADLAASPVPHLRVVRGEGAAKNGAGNNGAGNNGASGDGARRVPEKAAPHRGRRMRWAAPIAVAAGLVAFVGFGLDYLAGRDSGSSDSASSSGAGVADQGAASAPAGSQIFASGTDYTSANLAAEPVRPMTAPELNAPSSQKAPAATGKSVVPDSALQPLIAPEALQHCLDAIEQANAAGAISVTSVDYARFDGGPAVVVRFTATNGTWAWASGPACGSPGSDAATLGKVPVR